MLSGSLTGDDRLLVRLVGFGSISDGFIDTPNASNGSDSNGSTNFGGRLSIRSKPIAPLTLDLTASFNRSRFDAFNIATPASIATGDFENVSDFIETNEIDRTLLTFRGSYDFEMGSLIGTTSYFQAAADIFADTDFDPIDGFPSFGFDEDESVAQEVRFVSEPFDVGPFGEIAFVAGGNVSFSEFESRTRIVPGDPIFPLLTEGFLTESDGSEFTFSTEQDVFNFGVFYDVNWRPISKLELTVGGRFNRDRVRFSNGTFSSGIFGFGIPPFVPPPVPSVPTQFAEDTFSAFTPKGSVRYEWTEDFATYVTISTGFRGGGFNDGGADSPIVPFDEETVISYEGGFKSRWLGDRLVLNANAFFVDYDDFQIATTAVIDGAVQSLTANAASARSVGAEIQVEAHPFDGARLQVNYGLTQARFTNFPDSQFGDLSGTELPVAPDHTIGVVGEYARPTPVDGVMGFGRAEYSYVDDFRNIINPDPEFTFDAYDVLNLRVGLRAASWEVEMFVENALDETIVTGSGGLIGAGVLGTEINLDIQEPRRFGGRIVKRF